MEEGRGSQGGEESGGVEQVWSVNKFGGTSVANADAMRRARDIILAEMEGRGSGSQMAVVVSAMGGKPKVTDLLLKTVALAAEGDEEGYGGVLQAIRDKHTQVGDSPPPTLHVHAVQSHVAGRAGPWEATNLLLLASTSTCQQHTHALLCVARTRRACDGALRHRDTHPCTRPLSNATVAATAICVLSHRAGDCGPGPVVGAGGGDCGLSGR
jgi:hypothetical protein